MRNRFEAFVNSIIELNRYIQKIKDIEMKKFGLKASHTMCLYYLGQHREGLTATQLTVLCKEDKVAISRCLNQLFEAGLVFCVLPENKRSYRSLHYLTEDGKALVEKINSRIELIFFSGSCGISEEQRGALYDSMEIIMNNLSRYLDQQEK